MKMPAKQCISLGFSLNVHPGLEKPKEIQCFAGIFMKNLMFYLDNLDNLDNLDHLDPKSPGQIQSPGSSFLLFFY